MIDIVLVGVKGYGELYSQELLIREEQGKIRIKGFVDLRKPDNLTMEELTKRGISFYFSLESFYRQNKADLAIISSPLQFHCEHTCLALSNGSHVLCEKPVAATTNELKKMIEYRDRYRRKVAIGYQWAYSTPIQSLKKDILAGIYGKPLRLKSIVLWPRNEEYFSREWAGKIKDKSGRWVLDSVVANATSHFLLNMFYILGDKTDSSAQPKSILSETYRANDIENFDTAALKFYTDQEVELLFLASHTISSIEEYGPAFEYEFENGVIKYHGKVSSYNGSRKKVDEKQKSIIQGTLSDGTNINYGSLPNTHFGKLDKIIEAILDDNVTILCGLETAGVLPLCIEQIHQSVPHPTIFPENKLKFDKTDNIIWVDGLADTMRRCYEEWKLPQELGVQWAKSDLL